MSKDIGQQMREIREEKLARLEEQEAEFSKEAVAKEKLHEMISKAIDAVLSAESVEYGGDDLRNRYSVDQIETFMNEYSKELDVDQRGGVINRVGSYAGGIYPEEIKGELTALYLLRRHASLELDQCLELLADIKAEDAIRGRKKEEDSASGADKTNKKIIAARKFCEEEAAKWWAEEERKGEPITRIGEVSESLWRQLPHNDFWQPKTHETVKGWLKKAEKQGELRIPEEASKHGAAKK